MNNVFAFTNVIDISFNETMIDEMVDIFRVPADGDYLSTCRKIREAMNPISLTFSPCRKFYLAMCYPGVITAKSRDEVGISYQQIEARTAARSLPRLALRAIPSLIGETAEIGVDTTFLMPFPHKKATAKTGMVTCWKPEIYTIDENGYPLDFPHLRISVETFTALSAFKSDSYREFVANKYEKFEFGTEFLGKAGRKLSKKKAAEERFVDLTPSKGKQRNNHIALRFDDDRLDHFMGSRSGFYLKLKDMMQEAWGEAVHFEYRAFEGRKIAIGSGKLNKTTEKRLLQAAPETTLHMAVSDEEGALFRDILLAELQRHTKVRQVDQIEDADILLTYSADVIENRKLTDPKDLRKKGSQIINVPVEDAHDIDAKGMKPLVEVVLSELIRKAEILKGKIIHPGLEGIPRFSAVMRSSECTKLIHAIFEDGNLKIELEHEDVLMADYGAFATDHTIIMDGTKISIHQDTNLLGLPHIEVFRNMLASVVGEGNPHSEEIPRADVISAAESVGIPKEALASLRQFSSARQICKQFPGSGTAVGEGILCRNTGTNKKFAEKLEKMGWKIRSGVKKKRDQDLFGAMDGIFVSLDGSFYMSGAVGNTPTKFERFPVLRKLSADGPVPDSFYKLLEDTTIRHKQSTVLPFIFKYMREFLELQDNEEGSDLDFL